MESRQPAAGGGRAGQKSTIHSPLPSWFAPAFLLLVTIFLFRDFLSPRTHLVLSKFSEDMTQDFIGWRQFAFEQLRKGHLALWNPQMLCGAPFFGDFQSAILYPPNWLFMIFPVPLAVNTGIALHVFLMGWFTYLWIVQRGSRRESALVAAFMAMFGGAYFLHIVPGHLPNLCSMVWIPLVFLALDGWGQKRESRFLLLGMAALAMQILSGHVQYTYYTALVGGIYVLAFLPKRQDKFPYLVGLVWMGLGAALLTAVQLGAGWEASWDSLRGHKLPIDIVDIADMTPERLWCLLVPGFFGSWNSYWGGGFYWEGVTYASVTGFVLALFAFKVSDHPQKKTLGWLILFLIILSVGKRTVLFTLFYKFFPLFGNFRGVSKFNIFITLFMAVLAALALDKILENPKIFKGWAAPLIGGGLACGLMVAAFALSPRLGAEKFYDKFAAHAAPMEGSLLACGGILGLLGLFSAGSALRPALRYGFVILPFLELFRFAAGNLPFFPYQDYLQKIAPIREAYIKDPGDYRVLVGNSYALSAGGSDIWGEDPVIPSRFAHFVAQAQHCDPDQAFLQRYTFHEIAPALGLLRLRYQFTGIKGDVKAQRLHLKEAPRAFLADHWEVMSRAEAVRKAADPGFDWAHDVLLESDPGITEAQGKADHQVLVTDLSTDQIEIRARLSQPAILVLTDNYSPGWEAKSLSSPTTTRYSVLPANGFQRAIPLKAGDHHFLLEYRPVAFAAGKWISLVSLWFFLLLCKREYYRFRAAPQRGLL